MSASPNRERSRSRGAARPETAVIPGDDASETWTVGSGTQGHRRQGMTGFEGYSGRRVQRFSNTQVGSEPFAKFSTLLLFPTGHKSIELIRSAWKWFVLIVQPLQFHYCVVFRGLGRV